MRGRRAIEEETIMNSKLKYALIALPAALAPPTAVARPG